MIGLSVEDRRLDNSNPLSKDLARHILTRYKSGKIAIVTDRPVVLMSATRKQWVKIIRLTARERSSTLNPRKLEVGAELEHLQNLTFTATPPIYDPQADVCFATIEQFLQAPPVCHTIYITCATETQERYMLVAWMPPRGLVVTYER